MFTNYDGDEIYELITAATKPKTKITREDSVVQQSKAIVAKIDLKALAKVGSINSYDKGKVLFYQGDEGSDMFLILSGSVEILDEENVVAVLHVGDMFGEMSLVDGLPRSAKVVVRDKLDALRLSRENFNDVISNEPGIAFRIMQTLSKRIRLLNQNVFMLKNKGQE